MFVAKYFQSLNLKYLKKYLNSLIFKPRSSTIGRFLTVYEKVEQCTTKTTGFKFYKSTKIRRHNKHYAV